MAAAASQDPLPQVTPDISVVLLGKTGSGKSSVGNLLLGRQEFRVEFGFESNPDPCKMGTQTLDDGRVLGVVDTRGTMDTGNHEEAIDDISKSIFFCPEGFNAFIIVLRMDAKFTEEESNAVEAAVSIFGKCLYKFVLIVFTRAESIDSDTEKFDQVLKRKENPAAMIELLVMCDHRCVMIEAGKRADKEVQRQQIQQLMSMISKVTQANNGKKYTHELFDVAKRLRAEAEEKKKKIKEENEEETKRFLEAKEKEFRKIVHEMFATAFAAASFVWEKKIEETEKEYEVKPKKKMAGHKSGSCGIL